MKDIFDVVNDYIWLCDATALSVLFILAIKNRQPYSSFLTLSIATLVSFIIIEYQSHLGTIQGPDTNGRVLTSWSVFFFIFDALTAYMLYHYYQPFKTKNGTALRVLYAVIATTFLVCLVSVQYGPLFFESAGLSDKNWKRVAYYLGTALLDGIVIYSIHQSHRAVSKRYSLITKMYLLAFFVAALLQISRFFERYTWETDYLQEAYRWGLASINVSTTAVTFIITILAVYHHFSKKERKGILWDI
jgi:hypothetical protein